VTGGENDMRYKLTFIIYTNQTGNTREKDVFMRVKEI
jgi:hypothetical protein